VACLSWPASVSLIWGLRAQLVSVARFVVFDGAYRRLLRMVARCVWPCHLIWFRLLPRRCSWQRRPFFWRCVCGAAAVFVLVLRTV
jgi:hypothetical protein